MKVNPARDTKENPSKLNLELINLFKAFEYYMTETQGRYKFHYQLQRLT